MERIHNEKAIEKIPPNFLKRLKSFVENVQVSDVASEEEKKMILRVCDRNINEFENGLITKD